MLLLVGLLPLLLVVMPVARLEHDLFGRKRRDARQQRPPRHCAACGASASAIRAAPSARIPVRRILVLLTKLFLPRGQAARLSSKHRDLRRIDCPPGVVISYRRRDSATNEEELLSFAARRRDQTPRRTPPHILAFAYLPKCRYSSGTGRRRCRNANGVGTNKSVMTIAATAERRRALTREERKVIIASSAGTVFEWYDFYLYGALAIDHRRAVLRRLQRDAAEHLRPAHLRGGVHRASLRRHHFRPPWRHRRTQVHVRRHRRSHGRGDVPRRSAAELSIDRRRGTHRARRAAHAAGPRRRRRIRRRRRLRRRARTAEPARLLHELGQHHADTGAAAVAHRHHVHADRARCGLPAVGAARRHDASALSSRGAGASPSCCRPFCFSSRCTCACRCRKARRSSA